MEMRTTENKMSVFCFIRVYIPNLLWCSKMAIQTVRTTRPLILPREIRYPMLARLSKGSVMVTFKKQRSHSDRTCVSKACVALECR
jgi:hypothetical protein